MSRQKGKAAAVPYQKKESFLHFVIAHKWLYILLIPGVPVSYTHLTLPTTERV